MGHFLFAKADYFNLLCTKCPLPSGFTISISQLSLWVFMQIWVPHYKETYNETENPFWNIIDCFSNIVRLLPFSAGNGKKYDSKF